jgi:hypothetical protein
MEKRKNCWIIPTDQPSRLHYYFELNKKYALSKEPLNWKTASHIYITSDVELPYDNSIFATGAFYHRDAAKDIHIITKDTFHPNPNFCSRIILTTDDSLFKYGVQAIDDEFLEWFVKNPTCEFVEVINEPYEAGNIYQNDWFDYYKIIIPQEEPKQDWYCPKCQSYVSSESVTFEETHQTCNTSVIIEEPKQEFLLFDKERADTITSEGQKTVRELQNIIQHETLEEAAKECYPIHPSLQHSTEYKSSIAEKRLAFIFGAKWQAERMYAEADNIMRFLDTEVELKLSDTKTIERIKWYFETYFEQFKKK